jgi:prenyl protein peptidase
MSGLCASVGGAVLASLTMAGAYVGCLYVCARHRRGRRAPDRDDPRVIKERFARVAVACALAPAIAVAAAALPDRPSPCTPVAPLSRWFGLQPIDASTLVLATLLPLALTMVLFIGPLVMAWLDRDPETPAATQLRAWAAEWDLRMTRNLVVGPLSEEWVFRACMCPLLHGAGLSDAACVWTSGVVFGLAHVHHVFDADHAWIAVAIQFTYTTLFGAYSSYLFLRTGLLYGPILAHAFCNHMGLPDFGRALREKRTLGTAFVIGLSAFFLLTTLDAFYRPLLFRSMLWSEALV